jgi:VanZ family protein
VIRNYFKLGWWFLAFLHVGLIWAFSSRSGADVGLPAPYDKAAHFFSFALLGFLFAKAFNNPRIGFVIAALYGIADELHQSFVPLRDANIWDWVADALGAYFGSGSVTVLQKSNVNLETRIPIIITEQTTESNEKPVMLEKR